MFFWIKTRISIRMFFKIQSKSIRKGGGNNWPPPPEYIEKNFISFFSFRGAWRQSVFCTTAGPCVFIRRKTAYKSFADRFGGYMGTGAHMCSSADGTGCVSANSAHKKFPTREAFCSPVKPKMSSIAAARQAAVHVKMMIRLNIPAVCAESLFLCGETLAFCAHRRYNIERNST